MCGRYVLYGPEGRILDGFSLFELPPFSARFNIAPATDVLAVVGTGDGARQARMLRWGLIPHWAKDAEIGARLNNARSEGIAAKPAFRHAWSRSRCLLPANGFYEWQTLPAPGGRGRPRKQPWYVRARDDRLLAMAGLHERWHGPDGVVETCCVITTDANGVMAPIHDRMPVLIEMDDFDRWLHTPPGSAATLLELLAPAAADRIVAHPVDPAVNFARNEGERLIEPIDLQGPAAS